MHNLHDSLGAARRAMGEARGSALILVMLVLLLLTGLGMVALHDVSISVQQSGMHRVRTQASEGSNSLLRFMTRRVGDYSQSYWNMMQRRSQVETRAIPTFQERSDAVARGGWAKINSSEMATALPSGGGETGLFSTTDASTTSFESARGAGAQFNVILRDPLDGIRAPGYSGKFCFKKVTIVSEFSVGPLDPDLDQGSRAATGRHVTDGLIGPLECGSR